MGRAPRRSISVQAASRPEHSFKDLFDTLAAQLERVLRGKRRAVHLSLVCLFSEGHLLIEDVPGVGKTSLAKAIARSIGGSWRRVQFTPDLLPSDVTGVSVWDRARGDFEFRPGGGFANVVLADAVTAEDLDPVTDADTVAAWTRELSRIHVSAELRAYIVEIVEATRHHRDLMLGVSPRGALALQRASRALAASIGRAYVVPDDVKVLAASVLEHRLILSSEAMMRGVDRGDVLSSVLDTVPVPATRA